MIMTPCIACEKARVNLSSFTGFNIDFSFLLYVLALGLNTFELSLELSLCIPK